MLSQIVFVKHVEFLMLVIRRNIRLKCSQSFVKYNIKEQIQKSKYNLVRFHSYDWLHDISGFDCCKSSGGGGWAGHQ